MAKKKSHGKKGGVRSDHQKKGKLNTIISGIDNVLDNVLGDTVLGNILCESGSEYSIDNILDNVLGNICVPGAGSGHHKSSHGMSGHPMISHGRSWKSSPDRSSGGMEFDRRKYRSQLRGVKRGHTKSHGKSSNVKYGQQKFHGRSTGVRPTFSHGRSTGGRSTGVRPKISHGRSTGVRSKPHGRSTGVRSKPHGRSTGVKSLFSLDRLTGLKSLFSLGKSTGVRSKSHGRSTNVRHGRSKISHGYRTSGRTGKSSTKFVPDRMREHRKRETKKSSSFCSETDSYSSAGYYKTRRYKPGPMMCLLRWLCCIGSNSLVATDSEEEVSYSSSQDGARLCSVRTQTDATGSSNISKRQFPTSRKQRKKPNKDYDEKDQPLSSTLKPHNFTIKHHYPFQEPAKHKMKVESSSSHYSDNERLQFRSDPTAARPKEKPNKYKTWPISSPNLAQGLARTGDFDNSPTEVKDFFLSRKSTEKGGGPNTEKDRPRRKHHENGKPSEEPTAHSSNWPKQDGLATTTKKSSKKYTEKDRPRRQLHENGKPSEKPSAHSSNWPKEDGLTTEKSRPSKKHTEKDRPSKKHTEKDRLSKKHTEKDRPGSEHDKLSEKPFAHEETSSSENSLLRPNESSFINSRPSNRPRKNPVGKHSLPLQHSLFLMSKSSSLIAKKYSNRWSFPTEIKHCVDQFADTDSSKKSSNKVAPTIQSSVTKFQLSSDSENS